MKTSFFMAALVLIDLFSDKQYAQGVSAAMGGNRAARAGDEDLVKDSHVAYLLHTGVYDCHIASRVGHEDAVLFKRRAVADAVGDVLV